MKIEIEEIKESERKVFDLECKLAEAESDHEYILADKLFGELCSAKARLKNLKGKNEIKV